jgi:hypothetical protein
MEIIDTHAYSVNDKVKIAKDFLIDEILEGFGIEKGSVTLCDNTIIELIDEYTFEAGVRSLKRKLDTICSKLNLDRIYGKGPFKNIKEFSSSNPIVINTSDIHKYLSKPSLTIKKIHKTHDIGIVSGLYATTVGSGGIIPILVYRNHMGNSKFTLRLTGSQGKVMKESVMFSFTIAMNCVKNIYRKKFLTSFKSGLHIHTPDGATKKDGPSAGSAFTTAFISRILNKHIKHDIAMTGEIETNGLITEIGGLEQKLIGAKKAGVRLVFCPRENMSDLIKIKKNNPFFMEIWNPRNDLIINKEIELCEKEIDIDKTKKVSTDFKVLIVDNISDILRYALIDGAKTGINNYDTYKSYFDPVKYIEMSNFNNILNIECKDDIDDADDIDDNDNIDNIDDSGNDSDSNSVSEDIKDMHRYINIFNTKNKSVSCKN